MHGGGAAIVHRGGAAYAEDLDKKNTQWMDWMLQWIQSPLSGKSLRLTNQIMTSTSPSVSLKGLANVFCHRMDVFQTCGEQVYPDFCWDSHPARIMLEFTLLESCLNSPIIN